jgi:class 3 adenylate cyclase
MCIEDAESSDRKTLLVLNEFINDVRALLRDTEYALESSQLDSEELFTIQISMWLKTTLLPSIKRISLNLKKHGSKNFCKENRENVELALKRLTQQCLSPFGYVPFVRPKLYEPVSDTANDARAASDSIGRVLVVDDEWDILAILRHKLERLKFSVTSLTSPHAALKLAYENQYDIVIVDLHMPEMSGLEFLTCVAEDPRTKNVPVLVISASDDIGELSECLTRGAVDFLTKPVESSILRARTHSILEKKLSHDRERQMAAELAFEKARVDDLLSMILPHETVNELKETGSVKPRRFSDVAVLFCDVVNFTPYCESNSPEDLIAHLHSLFSEFDAVVELHGLQKIKTIGDSYMAVAGMLRPVAEPLLSAIMAGLEMIDVVSAHPSGWKVRVGVHIGDVIAGVVGTRQYLFDLWGDTVNIAARLEQSGDEMSVTVLKDVLLNAPDDCTVRSLGQVNLKGRGIFKLASVTRKDSAKK